MSHNNFRNRPCAFASTIQLAASSDVATVLGERHGTEQVRDDDAIRRFAQAVFDRSFVVSPQAFGWTIDLKLSLRALGLPLLFGLVAALLAGAIPSYRSSFRTAMADL